jgi:putative hydrolase of the HAD superfamily
MAVLGPEITRETFFAAYWKHRPEYDRGSYDGSAYWRRIEADLGLSLPGSAFERLVQADLGSWFNVRGNMLDFLGGIRARIGRLVLLSNIHADGARYLREGPGRAWAARFDELVLSCEHHLVKPEPEIYEVALSAARTSPGEVLFVDDIAGNVEGAIRAGMSSFRFTNEADFRSRIDTEFELAPLYRSSS